MSSRIGVDIGGTFTDLIYFDSDSGEFLVEKVPTTPKNPEVGCVDAVNKAVPRDLLKKSEYFLHGTTVGLNALLERRGATVGLLTTEGFRDVLEIRKGAWDDWYNLFWVPEEPLVPRRMRLPIRERITADGEVYTAFEPEDVVQAYEALKQEEVTAIAVAFMNAYSNPAHEIEAEKILREAGFDGAISLSHRVSGEYRDYERTSTTVIDAFVRGRLSSYMQHIETSLRENEFKGNCLITRSGSGSMNFSEAQDRPFETIMSGPVAGAEGAAELTKVLDLGDLVTADVGGTSFDTAFIKDGKPQLLYEGSVINMPLQTPWVDVRSIGAGGGSIAYIDAGGLLQVGPKSAGADPGPACYGQGGTEATVTDAAFYLGMLGVGELASGVNLDRSKSEAALAALADTLGYDAEQTARGIITIVGASMANAIRDITIEQGIDPRELTLLGFGGAGPMMATQLARELEIKNIIIPPFAGNFSAWGLLTSDLLQSTARTKPMKLNDDNIASTNKILSDLFIELSTRSADAIGGEMIKEVALDIRYLGQEHTMTIEPKSKDGLITSDTEDIDKIFADAYVKSYGSSLDSEREIVSIRASVRQPLAAGDTLSKSNEDSNENEDDSPTGTIDAYSFASEKTMEFKTYNRDALKNGTAYSGPAIIYEPTATTYIDSDFTFSIIAGGCLKLSQGDQ